MKCEHPSLYAALLVGVLVNVRCAAKRPTGAAPGRRPHWFARRCWPQ